MNPDGFSPLITVLLLALLLLVLGGAAVVFISRGGQKNNNGAKPPNQPLPDLDALAPAAPSLHPPQPGVMMLASGESVRVVEVMRVARDAASGALIAEIDGRAYYCPPQDADDEFMRSYSAAVRELSATSEPAPVQPDPPSAAAPAPPVPTAATAPAPTPAVRPSTTASANGPLPGDLPKFTMPETSAPPRLGRRPSAAPIPEINIAESIEAFLQYRLASNSELASRSIHVLPAGEDGVRIEVDGLSYEGIDNVSDPAVQDFLRHTIQEWQQRQ